MHEIEKTLQNHKQTNIRPNKIPFDILFISHLDDDDADG